MDKVVGCFLALLIGGAIALVVWLVIADGKDMAAKRETFMAACAADGRKPYDCNLQWDTFEAAHDAQMQAAMATGMAAGAAGSAAAANAGRR